MPEVSKPEFDVDELMGRVKDTVRRRWPPGQPPGAPAARAPDWAELDRALVQAQQTQNVGATLPPMSRTSGLTRLVAAPIARGFLRLAQLITRDQRGFNQALVELSRALLAHARATEDRVQALEARVEEAETRSAALEARLARRDPSP